MEQELENVLDEYLLEKDRNVEDLETKQFDIDKNGADLLDEQISFGAISKLGTMKSIDYSKALDPYSKMNSKKSYDMPGLQYVNRSKSYAVPTKSKRGVQEAVKTRHELIQEKLDYLIGSYNNSVFVSKSMKFEDKEKLQKEYNIFMNKNSNIDNILYILAKVENKRKSFSNGVSSLNSRKNSEDSKAEK